MSATPAPRGSESGASELEPRESLERVSATEKKVESDKEDTQCHLRVILISAVCKGTHASTYVHKCS